YAAAVAIARVAPGSATHREKESTKRASRVDLDRRRGAPDPEASASLRSDAAYRHSQPGSGHSGARPPRPYAGDNYSATPPWLRHSSAGAWRPRSETRASGDSSAAA